VDAFTKIRAAGFSLSIEGGGLAVAPASKLTERQPESTPSRTTEAVPFDDDIPF
jgi:hypothetical protein